MPTGYDAHVPELGRDTMGAAQQLAAVHDPTADPGADRDAHHVLDVLRGAEGELAPGRGVRVVLDHHGDLQRVRDPGAERLVPPGQVRREQHGRPVRRDEPGGADPDRLHVVPGDQFGGRVADRRGGAVDRVRRGIAIRAGTDHSVRSDQAGRDLRSADIDADRQSHGSGSTLTSIRSTRARTGSS